jgi:hypothetical protein
LVDLLESAAGSRSNEAEGIAKNSATSARSLQEVRALFKPASINATVINIEESIIHSKSGVGNSSISYIR